MDATKVNTFVASIAPPSATIAIPDYLDDALKALGLKSGVELAGRIGIAPATLASWKSRGAVPHSHVGWFTEVFVIQIFMAWLDRVPHGGDLPLGSVVSLLRRTNCNPFSADEDNADLVTSHGIGGLTALARFLMGRQRALLIEQDHIVTETIACQLEECINIHRDALLRLL